METLHLSIVKANVKNRICASVRRGERQLSVKCICNKLFLLSILVMFSGNAIVNGQESFTPTGSMSKNRGGSFTLTRLINGKIFVVGGAHSQAENLATAELYDPATGIWTPTGSMYTGRSNHTATLLADGRVLVAGGYGASGFLNSAEIYDPTSGTWSVTGSMSEGRAGHTAFLLNNGKVLAAAGMYQGSGDTFGKSSAELYDPVSGTWSITGSLGTARMHQQGACLSDGRILIAGGQPRGVTSVNFASAEIYNPALGTWTATGSMITPRRQSFTLTLLSDGKVLVAAGNISWTSNY